MVNVKVCCYCGSQHSYRILTLVKVLCWNTLENSLKLPLAVDEWIFCLLGLTYTWKKCCTGRCWLATAIVIMQMRWKLCLRFGSCEDTWEWKSTEKATVTVSWWIVVEKRMFTWPSQANVALFSALCQSDSERWCWAPWVLFHPHHQSDFQDNVSSPRECGW